MNTNRNFKIYALANSEGEEYSELYVKTSDGWYMEVDDFFSDGGHAYSHSALTEDGDRLMLMGYATTYEQALELFFEI